MTKTESIRYQCSGNCCVAKLRHDDKGSWGTFAVMESVIKAEGLIKQEGYSEFVQDGVTVHSIIEDKNLHASFKDDML